MSNTSHTPLAPDKPTIKILVYTDDPRINLTNDLSQFFGLGAMKERLLAHQSTFANFDVQLFSADNDAGNKLDYFLKGKDFDEIWFFGLQSNANNFPEWRRIHDSGAGIFMTGGPANEDPPYGAENSLSTISGGAFQTDRLPQQLQLRPVNVNGDPDPDGQPHPLFFYKEGRFIDVFPDHALEGAVAIPGNIRPQVVALSKDARKPGEPVNIIATYNGDLAGVGRIVTDSTRHHYMNLNLRGFPHPDQIGQFYANLAIWLAPKHKREEMAHLMFWELASYPLLKKLKDAESIGAAAESVLAMTTSPCEVHELTQVSTPKEVADLYAAGEIELPSKEKLIGSVIQSYQDAMRAGKAIDATKINAGFKRAFKEHRAEIRKTSRTLSAGPLIGARIGACNEPSEKWTIETVENWRDDRPSVNNLYVFCLSIRGEEITGTVADVDSGELLSEYVTGKHISLGGSEPGFSMSLEFDTESQLVKIEGVRFRKNFLGKYNVSAAAAEAAATSTSSTFSSTFSAVVPPPPGDGDMGSASGTQT